MAMIYNYVDSKIYFIFEETQEP